MVENILLVTIDSLRYDTWLDHLPDLCTSSELAAEGVSFERAFATGPGTSPSFPGLLTGTYSLSHGGLGPLTDSRPRVAAELREQGLATGGFHSNPFLSTHFEYDVGFDEFHDYQNPLMGVATRVFPRGIELNNSKLAAVDNAINLTGFIKSVYKRINGKSRPYVNAEVITDDAIEWIDGRDDPFFCWAHYMDVHHPCFPPKEYRSQYGVEHVDNDTVSKLYTDLVEDASVATDAQLADMAALYCASISYVDDQIGRLIEHLRTAGKFEDTLVVLTSDHGELHGEYDQFGKPARMYDELLHVPLVIANGPEDLAERREWLVSLLDVPPLFHAAIGESIPNAYEGQPPEADPRQYVVAEHEVDGEAIIGARSAHWLYEHDDIEDRRRLFELPSMTPIDPQQVSNNPEVSMLTEVAERRLDGMPPRRETPKSVELDSDVEGRLEDLGYR
jgi:arylsulfatase A-like enzyme